MKNKNKNYSLELCLAIFLLALFMSSCASSRHYTGCDGKKKIKMINKW